MHHPFRQMLMWATDNGRRPKPDDARRLMKVEELPIDASREVCQLIQDMSFANFADERAVIWDRSKEVRLLKLYDKISNLLDASHYSVEKWSSYVDFTRSLIADVENNYGQLNIIKIAKSVAINKP